MGSEFVASAGCAAPLRSNAQLLAPPVFAPSNGGGATPLMHS